MNLDAIYNDLDYNSKMADQEERDEYDNQNQLVKELIELYNKKDHSQDGRNLVIDHFIIQRRNKVLDSKATK